MTLDDILEQNSTEYLKYRGKCKELSEKYIQDHPEYEIIKGWYWCPFWGKQQHFWTRHKKTKEIVDPSKNQFPSKGMGEYIEYDGMLECEYCGTSIHEEDVYFVDHHVYCSYTCYGRDVM